MHIVSLDGATSVGSGKKKDHTPIDGFVFDLPDELATHLLGFPNWRRSHPDDYTHPESIIAPTLPAPKRGKPKTGPESGAVL